MGGDDTLAATGFPSTSAVVLIGGEGADTLSGGEASEDVLVDGPRRAATTASRRSAATTPCSTTAAPTTLFGGDGNDLFLSVSICDGEPLDGGAGRDNASWARLAGDGVAARLDQGRRRRSRRPADRQLRERQPRPLSEIEDLEGSNPADILVGDGGPNQLLGHLGPDTYFALAGDDSILANSGDADPVIDCGEGHRLGRDRHPHAAVRRRRRRSAARGSAKAAPNNFETDAPNCRPTPPPPPPTADRPPRPQAAADQDHRTPRGQLLTIAGHGAAASSSASPPSERGSHFRCKLDRKPYRPCTSPRAYTVGLGPHAVRVVAIDAAGNADRSPALFRFRVRGR